MLPIAPRTYEQAQKDFVWQIPEHYNIGFDACGKWAQKDPGKLALIYLDDHGKSTEYSFGQVYSQACRFARWLQARGIERGARVAILLPQAPETAYAHIGCYIAGCVALPLFTLFGTEAIRFRLADSGAKLVVTNSEGAAKVGQVSAQLPELELVLCIDGAPAGALDFHQEIRQFNDAEPQINTLATDPAVIIYTSGTTGNPKGALHGQQILLGHLPGVEISHDLLPQDGDRIWTPADWAWIGGLFDVLMPAWHHGIPVVAHRFRKFDPARAFELLQDFGVRNTFLPPTALKLMRTVAQPEKTYRLDLRSVASGGESLGHELLEWGRSTFGLTINEFYGQTECNMTVSSCAALMPVRPGAIGKPVPGHTVAIIDDSGNSVPTGSMGHIAVRSPDPVMFLGYWNNPAATTEKFIGPWLVTGDTGRMDAEGYVHFVGRKDDVITSAGYRIGPTEIEDCILRHPAVKMVAVVGTPDAQRTELVVAVVVPKEGHPASDALRQALQEHVKNNLAAYEYPREVYFVQELPMTTTGKVIRKDLRQMVADWRAGKATNPIP